MQARMGEFRALAERLAPVREPRYLAWLRYQPCCVCGRLPSIGHHPRLPGAAGMGQKPDDRTAVPLCFGHHTGREGVHQVGERAFWPRHGADPVAVAKRLWARYAREKSGRAAR